MSATVQTPVLRIGIDGVAKPVPVVIARRDASQAKQDRLLEEIKELRKKPRKNQEAIKELERQVAVIQVDIDRHQDPLDAQFPRYTPTPNQ